MLFCTNDHIIGVSLLGQEQPQNFSVVRWQGSNLIWSCRNNKEFEISDVLMKFQQNGKHIMNQIF